MAEAPSVKGKKARC